MRIRDRYDMVRQNMRESLVFVTVNVLAISLGVFLLSVLLALSLGVEKAIDRMMAAQVSPLLIEVRSPAEGEAGRLLSERARREIRALPEVTRVDPVILPVFGNLFRDSTRHVFVSVMSVTGPDDPELARVRWMSGSGAELSRRDNALVVPVEAARALGWHDPARLAGQRVTVRFLRKRGSSEEALDLPFVIIGVASSTRLSRCFVPFATMARIAAWHAPAAGRWAESRAADAPVDIAHVYARSVRAVPSIRARIEARGYRTKSVLDTVEAYNQILSITRLVLGLVVGIAFLAGAASIFNATYASVLRRFREFAVFKTYGASRRDLYALVLLENVLAALAASVVGFGTAAVACMVLNRAVSEKIGDDIVPIEPGIFLIAMLTAIATCVAASLIPARMAARLSVVTAIASARER